eukprot:NODE_438_length_7412_cov_0.582798.p3 type:complete len:379 gc:universal NODE_438_length_7412_cov_0.582798:5329-6465(+)
MKQILPNEILQQIFSNFDSKSRLPYMVNKALTIWHLRKKYRRIEFQRNNRFISGQKRENYPLIKRLPLYIGNYYFEYAQWIFEIEISLVSDLTELFVLPFYKMSNLRALVLELGNDRYEIPKFYDLLKKIKKETITVSKLVIRRLEKFTVGLSTILRNWETLSNVQIGLDYFPDYSVLDISLPFVKHLYLWRANNISQKQIDKLYDCFKCLELLHFFDFESKNPLHLDHLKTVSKLYCSDVLSFPPNLTYLKLSSGVNKLNLPNYDVTKTEIELLEIPLVSNYLVCLDFLRKFCTDYFINVWHNHDFIFEISSSKYPENVSNSETLKAFGKEIVIASIIRRNDNLTQLKQFLADLVESGNGNDIEIAEFVAQVNKIKL